MKPSRNSSELTGSRHRGRVLHGRLLLILVFLLTRAADAILLYYTFQPSNPFPTLCGWTIGHALWSTILVIFVWRRQMWALLVLLGVTALNFLIFCVPVLSATGRQEPAASSPWHLVVWGLALYAVGGAVLLGSRRIRRLAAADAVGR
jgi:hypothetical protein